MREGTLSQLRVKVGDKVRPIRNPHGGDIRSGRLQVISKADPYYGWYEGYTMDKAHRDDHRLGEEIIFRLEEQAMKTWEDMNCKEQCELKEAYRTGKTIQFFSLSDKVWEDCHAGRGPAWLDGYAYRVKPNEKDTEMKLWKDMTACEKGALLLAYHHEGKTVEYKYCGSTHWDWSTKRGGSVELAWYDDHYYRVKRKPGVTEVVRYGQVCNGVEPWGGGFAYSMIQGSKDTHKITFNLVDGVPDCNSIKMVKM